MAKGKSCTESELRKSRQDRRTLPVSADGDRPKLRADCADTERPCPFVGCRYHLALLDVKRDSARWTFGSDVDDILSMEQTCALDVADRGHHTTSDVAALCNLSRQRVSQIETSALQKLKAYYKAQRPQDLLVFAPVLRQLFNAQENDDHGITDTDTEPED